MNSTHKVEVVPVHLEKHPNADTLSRVKIWGYQALVRTSDWTEGELGAYIPPDSIVDSTRPEFAFCAGHERIRVKRLRGEISMGLLVKAPPGSAVGDDVAELLGVKHYDPVLNSKSGEAASPPGGWRPVYDVESARRYSHLFVPGEPLWVTEKIHGANARFCFHDGAMHAGSRTEWKRTDETVLWWKALAAHPEVEAFCRANPDCTVYGEVYGPVQDLKYGRSAPGVVVFDILRGPAWMDPGAARIFAPYLPWVPMIPGITFDTFDELAKLAEGPSMMPGADHVREGVVVKPIEERYDQTIGRVCLKIVGNGYLERA